MHGLHQQRKHLACIIRRADARLDQIVGADIQILHKNSLALALELVDHIHLALDLRIGMIFEHDPLRLFQIRKILIAVPASFINEFL